MMLKLTKMIIVALLFTGMVFKSPTVKAQGTTASDLIDAVNTLRSNAGLAAYQVDSSIMAYAQQHADYMASTQNATHTHSDGSSPLDSGYQENIASGSVDFMTSDFVINTIWADAVHSKTMLGYASGLIGAGAAIGSNGQIYLVINVRPGQAVSQPAPTNVNSSQAVSQQAPTSDSPVQTQPVVTAPTTSAPLVTATTALRSDTAIEHTVAENEALWSIAMRYGVKIDEIRQWNGLAAGDNFLIVGQKLKIFLPVTATPEMSATPTPIPSATATTMPATATQLPTVTVIPTEIQTPTATPVPGLFDLLYEGDKTAAVIVVIAAGLLGVLLVQIRSRKEGEIKPPSETQPTEE